MDAARSHDQGFVAAASREVYAVLGDPGTYPRWWAGSTVRGGDLWLPISRRAAIPERARDGTGLYLVFGEESLEWYLEPFEEGTIVNAFLEVRRPRWRASRRLTMMRGVVRRGLVGLKQLLEDGR